MTTTTAARTATITAPPTPATGAAAFPARTSQPVGSASTRTVEGSPAAAADQLDAVMRSGRHGAVTHSDALRELGTDQVRAALESGRWIALWSTVLVTAERVRDPMTQASAALLRAGPCSVLSGSTAAAMHGCTAADNEVLTVTIPYDRQPRPVEGLAVRQAWIRESDVVELDGLRVFALDMALSELLCSGPRRLALACLEQALGALNPEARQHFRRLVGERIERRRDRRGTRQACALLEMAWLDPTAFSLPESDRSSLTSEFRLGRVGSR